MAYLKHHHFSNIILLVIFIYLFCVAPQKPDFDILTKMEYGLFYDPGCADTLKQGCDFLCEDTLEFTLKIKQPHEITFIKLSLKDTIDNVLFNDSIAGILPTDSIFSIGIYRLLYPGTDTVSLTIIAEDTTIYNSFTIQILGLPPVIGTDKKITASGKNIVDSLYYLHFSLSGTEPIKYHWYKNDVEFISNKYKDTLRFSALSLSDNGSYKCIVENQWGQDSTEPFNLSISDINTAPLLLNGRTIHESCTPQLLDSNFYLSVKSSGTEPLNYSWSKNGNLIPGFRKDTLYFATALSYEDTAIYVCTLSNDYGVDISESYKLVFGNHAPEWKTDTILRTVRESRTLVLNLSDSCSDEDNDPITFHLSSGKPSGDMLTEEGIYTFTPSFNDSGNFIVSILAFDTKTYTPLTLNLAIANDNNRPNFKEGLPKLSYRIKKEELLRINFKADDPDSEHVFCYVANTTLPHQESITTTDSSLEWQSLNSDSGYFKVIINATDFIDTTVIKVDIAVGGQINLPPRIALDTYQSGVSFKVTETDTLSLQFEVTDPDSGGNIDFKALDIPDSAIFHSVNKTFRYIPNFNISSATKENTFTNIAFIATDKAMTPLSDTFMINIQVLDSNTAPELDKIEDTVCYEGDTLSIDLSAKDINGDSILLAFISIPPIENWPIIDIGNGKGTFKWAPDYTDSGTYNVVFVATDGVLFDKKIVNINVKDKKYVLKASCTEHGSISPKDSIIVEPGTDQQFTITSDTGHHIDSVLIDGDNIGDTSFYSFSDIDTNHTIEAFFSINMYEVEFSRNKGTIQDNNGGMPNITNDTTLFISHGKELKLIVTGLGTSRIGYQFSNWRIDTIDTIDYPLKIIITSPKKIQADVVRDGMVLVPSREVTFIMGSDLAENEKPPHDVTLTYSFWMDETEVTQKDYDDVMSVIYSADGYTQPDWSGGGGDNRPAWNINWFDAVLYCNARSKKDALDPVYTYTGINGIPGNDCDLVNLVINFGSNGYRLPTEAEWVFACGGGDTTEYVWGDVWNNDSAKEIAVCNNGISGSPNDVKTKDTTFFAIYDILGNVTEWINDWFGDYPAGSINDPTGPPNSITDIKVLRGGYFGSIDLNTNELRTQIRLVNHELTYTSKAIGFRVVRPQTNHFKNTTKY